MEKRIIISIITYILLWSFFLFFILFPVQGSAEIFSIPNKYSENTQAKWVNLESKMLLSKDKYIILYWKGTGGDLSLMLDFKNTIQKLHTQGKVIIAKLTGHAWSMHAYSLCYVDSIQGNGYYEIIFHPLTKYGEIDKSSNDIQTAAELLSPCVAKKLLTWTDVYYSLTNYEVHIKDNGKIKYYIKDPRQS